jgi:hypothetical protein
LLPVLVPSFISIALIRLSLAARSSRARIKLLEKDESSQETLIRVIAQLEKRVEDAVVDMLDDPCPITDSETQMYAPLDKKEQPILSPTQFRIVASLNKLPNLKKELAFIHPVRNSHAVIVCRDVKRFPSHNMGEGVLRHWAHSFVM